MRVSIEVEEFCFSIDDLFNVDEVWLFLLSKEIVFVVEVNGMVIGDGNVGDMW